MPPRYRKRLGTRLKKTARGAKRIAGRVAKSAYKGYTKLRDYQNASALAMAGMRLMNVEKKRLDVAPNQTGTAFALTAGLASGAYVSDITPAISQGISGTTRNGNSIKLVSACLDIQVKQQPSCVNQFRYKYFIVCRPDASQTLTPTIAFDQFCDVNPFTGFRDIHSNRDPEFYGQFRVIKRGSGSLSQDQVTSGVGYNQFKIPLKLNHHLKYNSDASTTTTKNQMFLFFVADSGDSVAGTGALAYYNVRYYYVDN